METKRQTKPSSRTGGAKRRTTTKSSKETLSDIFEDQLKDIYWAEKHLVKALPKMAKAAHNQDLQQAFENHLEQTKAQVEKVERCFNIMDKKPTAKKCEAMDGLLKEGAEAIEDYAKGHARDSALIAAAQKVEHYEISSYGTMRSMANVLGKQPCAEILHEIELEEANTDKRLTALSERINRLATEMGENEVN
jgi:ferritin-like metal-binding protein YciE